MNLIEQHKTTIEQLCIKHKVKNLYVFGSVVTDKLTSTSDIDLLVEFDDMDPERYADNYYDLKFSLEELLQKPIDLLEIKAIKNPYFKQAIDRRKQLIYGC
jgi:predicted nucleotidyltransferase